MRGAIAPRGVEASVLERPQSLTRSDPGREPIGGNGLLLDNHVIRHIGDIEVIHTYESTETMRKLMLIVGRDITGVGAFTH